MFLPSAGMRLLGWGSAVLTDLKVGAREIELQGDQMWAPSPGEMPGGASGGRHLGIIIQQWRLKMWM